MSEQTLTNEALLTFLTEAEKVLNDHPIVKASSHVDVFAALTPNHLILRRHCPSLPPGDFDKQDMYNAWWRQLTISPMCFGKGSQVSTCPFFVFAPRGIVRNGISKWVIWSWWWMNM
jgi:hypothetical protein